MRFVSLTVRCCPPMYIGHELGTLAVVGVWLGQSVTQISKPARPGSDWQPVASHIGG